MAFHAQLLNTPFSPSYCLASVFWAMATVALVFVLLARPQSDRLFVAYFVRIVPIALSATSRPDPFPSNSGWCCPLPVLLVWMLSLLASLVLLSMYWVYFVSMYWLDWMVSAAMPASFRSESYNWHSHNHLPLPTYLHSRRFVCLRTHFHIHRWIRCVGHDSTACYPNWFPFAYHQVQYVVRPNFAYRLVCGSSLRKQTKEKRAELLFARVMWSFVMCEWVDG